MSNIEKVEVEIDRVIAYLDCGCVQKSDITINVAKLAQLKKDAGKEMCKKHDGFVSKTIYICKQCRTVDTVSTIREDTRASVYEKVYATHRVGHSQCTIPSPDIVLVLLFKSPTEISIREGSIPEWAIERVRKIMQEEKITIRQEIPNT